MAYIDTSVLLSYYFTDDVNHDLAVGVVEELRRERRGLYVSPLTVVELFSAVSRRLPELRVPPQLRYLDEGARVRVLVKHILRALDPVVVGDELRAEPFDGVEFFHVFAKAVGYSHVLKLRTLDLVHIAYALRLVERGLVDTVVSLDRELLSKEQLLRSIGLGVVVPTAGGGDQ